MAIDGIVVGSIAQILIVYLLLLLLAFAVPKLQPIFYALLFFYTLAQVIVLVVKPFTDRFLHIFSAVPDPFAKLLIGSAIFYYIGEVIALQIQQAGYEALAEISRLCVKITILSIWLSQIAEVLKLITSFITK